MPLPGCCTSPFIPAPSASPACARPRLKPLDLGERDFGVDKPADFRWNQLLGFDACVQCGKCEAACPAFAAGQPLNPKKLIQDLVAGLAGESDAAYAGSPYPGIAVGAHAGSPDLPIVPSLIEAETIWSCTTCRACVEECPMLIEHVDAIVDMRRSLNLVRGEAPGKAAETLANLRETETQGGFTNAARYNWAADLNVKVAKPGVPVDVLLHRWRRRLRHALPAHAARAGQGAEGGERGLRRARRSRARQRATPRAGLATKRPSRRLHGATSKRSIPYRSGAS